MCAYILLYVVVCVCILSVPKESLKKHPPVHPPLYRAENIESGMCFNSADVCTYTPYMFLYIALCNSVSVCPVCP